MIYKNQPITIKVRYASLGTHISKIRSLTLDTTSYTPDLVQLIKLIGNARSNAIWEATLSTKEQHTDNPPPTPSKFQFIPETAADSDWEDLINMIAPPSIRVPSPSSSASLDPSPTLSPTQKKPQTMRKPTSTDTREVKKKFITAKYVDRAFVDFSLVDEDKTATDLLFQAVKANDIPLAMQAIALKADVNAARRFEVQEDHGLKTPLLLSLLHIEPSKMVTEEEKTLFPMAELLLQNGSHVENVLFDNLEDMLGVASQPIVRSSSRSVGTWVTDVVNDMNKSGKTILDVVQSSGDIAAIRYITPKVLARGTPSVTNSASLSTTSTGGVVNGNISEKKSSSSIGRSISISVRNVLS